MSKHTENWKTEYDGALVMDGQIISGPLGPDTASHEEKKANTILAASAPEMLKLAEHIASFSDDAYLSGHPEFSAMVDEAKQIIAKTKGE